MLIAGSLILSPHKSILAEFPDIPSDDDGPVFREPWEAQAFAMTVALHRAGHCTWGEWAETLSRELKAQGPKQGGDQYYLCWLTALEKITAAKNLTATPELLERKSAWDRAARATPHGEPIELGRENRAH